MKLEELFQIKLKARYMVQVFFVQKVDEFNSMGNFTPSTREIKILDDLSHEDKCATLLHELLHALSDAYDLDLTESAVLRLEKGLIKMYSLNPDLKSLMINI